MFISPCLSFIFLSLVWNFSDRDITLNREFGSSSQLRHNIAKIANFPAGADNIKRTRLHYHREFMLVSPPPEIPRHINQDQSPRDWCVTWRLSNIASCAYIALAMYGAGMYLESSVIVIQYYTCHPLLVSLTVRGRKSADWVNGSGKQKINTISNFILD